MAMWLLRADCMRLAVPPAWSEQSQIGKSAKMTILRGIAPEHCVAVGRMLVEEGFCLIEVPMNSPRPLLSIERLAGALGGQVVVGAGTVLTCEQVNEVACAGGRLVVSPNANAQVVQATCASGLYSVPGFATASEAFAMLDAGADALKLFPAEAFSPQVLKALRAVLPAEVAVLPVGGIGPAAMAPWRAAGAAGFGLGSALYRPGDDLALIRKRAHELVAAWHALLATAPQRAT
jgi:2-dehydro-3-deoxyphosphogalactonate aldolase